MDEEWIVSRTARNLYDASKDSGYEFSILDFRGRTLLTISYNLEAKAKAAERAVRTALESAAEVFFHS